MSQRLATLLFALLPSAGFLAACGDGSATPGAGGSPAPTTDPGATALVTVELTDAPFEHALLASAILRIDRITAHPSGDEGTGFVTVYEGAPVEIDLAPLVDGENAVLASHLLPVGSWSQMRLYVASAELELANGNLYMTEDGTLQLPSADASGLKVFFDPPLVLEKDVPQPVVIDFDLTQSFHPIPANDPEDADHYQMHPVLRVEEVEGGGSVEGFVSAADGSPFAAATVYVLSAGQSEVDGAIASTGSALDGAYAVEGLAPGEYALVAHFGELTGSSMPVVVESGQATQLDLVVQ